MIDIWGSVGKKGLRSEEELGGVWSDLTGYLAFRKWVACTQAWLVAQEWYCVSQVSTAVQNARVINGKDERFVFFTVLEVFVHHSSDCCSWSNGKVAHHCKDEAHHSGQKAKRVSVANAPVGTPSGPTSSKLLPESSARSF